MQTRHFSITALGFTVLFALSGGSVAQTPARTVGGEFIPGDAVATIVLSVADTMASPMAELYPIEVADAWCKTNVGFLASTVDRIKFVIGAPGPGAPMMAVVATLRVDVDLSKVSQNVLNTQQPIDIDGHACYQVAPDVVLHVKDPRTLILATPNYLDTVIRAANASAATGALAKMAASVPHTGNMTALLAIEPIRPMVSGLLQSQIDQIPPPLVEFTKVPELLDALLFRLDLNDQASGLNLVMLAKDDASAEELLALVQRGLAMGRQIGLAQAMGQIEGEDEVAQASRQYAQRIADKMVATLTPTRSGRRLSLSASASQGFATQGVLVALLLPAVQSAREAARRVASSNNMKMIGLAMHNSHATYNQFPTDIKSADGTPLLSWRVAILPFIEEGELYQQFHLDEPWNSPHNVQLLEQMPAIYSHPALPTPPGTTVYQRPSGDGYIMNPAGPVKLGDITDGTSNTIMAVETLSEQAVPWTEPRDLSIDKEDPLLSVVDGSRQGFNVTLADGAVLFMSNSVEPETFLGLLTRDGRENVSPHQ